MCQTPALTGKTMGMPPRTAFDPSRRAFELRKRFSLPLALFHEMTVAPCRRTATNSPDGRVAVTRSFSFEIMTRGEAFCGDTGMLLGLCARSMCARSMMLMLVIELKNVRVDEDG